MEDVYFEEVPTDIPVESLNQTMRYEYHNESQKRKNNRVARCYYIDRKGNSFAGDEMRDGTIVDLVKTKLFDA